MRTITLEQSVAAPIERVWAVLTDIEGAKANLSGVTKIERLAGTGYTVGVTWRETRKIFGREETEEMTVAEVDAPRRTVVVAHSRGIAYRTEFLLVPTGSGTNLTMVFSGESGATGVRALVEKVFAPLGAAVTRRMMAADLADVARRAAAG